MLQICLSFLKFSKKFRIDEEIRGLVNIDNEPYILEKNGSILKVSVKKVILEILEIDVDFSKNIRLEIKEKNNFTIDFVGQNEELKDETMNWLNILEYKYLNYTFNVDKTRPLCHLELNVLTNVVKLKNVTFFMNKFLYYPLNYPVKEKNYDLYFHGISEENDLYNTCIKLGIDIGDEFETCRFIIIKQNDFEKLSSLRISEFIYHNCLIISLIDEERINSNTFVKNYTSSNYLNKLFLFNIAENEEYINFVMEKIIYDNQYEKRKKFMKVERERLTEECSIFKGLLEMFKSLNKPKETCKLYEKVSTKFSCSHMKAIINSIIRSDYESDISVFENTHVPEIIQKVNFLGNVKRVSDDDNIISDILIVPNLLVVKRLTILNQSIIIYCVDENIEINPYSDLE